MDIVVVDITEVEVEVEVEAAAAAAAAATAARGFACAFMNRGATGLYRGREVTAGREAEGAILCCFERVTFSLSVTLDAEAPRPILILRIPTEYGLS